MVIRTCGCDQKREKLSGIEQQSFQVLPEGCDRGAISYLEGERVPKSRWIMTEGI